MSLQHQINFIDVRLYLTSLLLMLLLGGCEHSSPTAYHKKTVKADLQYSQQLSQLAAADQADRQRLFALFKRYGFHSPQADSGNRWLPRRDSVRFAQFQGLLVQYGWPRPAQVGAAGMRNTFLFVQHAPDSAAHTRFYADMQAAFQRKDILAAEWATYLDRYLLYQGRPQRYGTQSERRVLGSGREENYLLPVEDFAALDARRLALGLDSITPELRPGTLILKE